MNQTTIFLPVMALVDWTLIVLVLVACHRFKAAFAGRVTALRCEQFCARRDMGGTAPCAFEMKEARDGIFQHAEIPEGV
ncbi:hypothetical protein EGT07_15205 [Herbaspirillum sp. HC18]|nr:hypothetical protein EGT07_15205 [Herbaspirillum sp. HC18]